MAELTLNNTNKRHSTPGQYKGYTHIKSFIWRSYSDLLWNVRKILLKCHRELRLHLHALLFSSLCCSHSGAAIYNVGPLTSTPPPQQASMTAVVMQVLPCICLNEKARREMRQCGCKQEKQEKFWWHFLPTQPSSCSSMSASDSVRGCFQLVLTVNPAGIAPLWLKYQPTIARDLQWQITTSRGNWWRLCKLPTEIQEALQTQHLKTGGHGQDIIYKSLSS